MNVALVILAAGESRRMGRAKQLLPWRGKTLVRHAVEQARQFGASPIVVVVGARAAEITAEISDPSVSVVENSRWGEGLGTSLSAGFRFLLAQPSLPSAAIVALGDQPLVDADVYRRLLAALHAPHVSACAAAYAGSVGVPALFSARHFLRLSALPPNAGAKKLLLELGPEVARVEIPEAALDVDTPEDYDRLRGTR